jgi:CRISPR-associated protein Cas2
MAEMRVDVSGYRAVWLFAMFDLPMVTKLERALYMQFRKTLLKNGFSMLQFSVYARYCPSEESGEVFRRHVRAELPPEGQVRLISITDKQFGKMEIFYGRNRSPVEEAPQQLMLF